MAIHPRETDHYSEHSKLIKRLFRDAEAATEKGHFLQASILMDFAHANCLRLFHYRDEVVLTYWPVSMLMIHRGRQLAEGWDLASCRKQHTWN